jgi:hypothetical protein
LSAAVATFAGRGMHPAIAITAMLDKQRRRRLGWHDEYSTLYSSLRATVYGRCR